MFLLSKILLKFTPKLNKLHLTTITLFKANFNKIYSKLHHLDSDSDSDSLFNTNMYILAT